jgi:hypothetical protein
MTTRMTIKSSVKWRIETSRIDVLLEPNCDINSEMVIG